MARLVPLNAYSSYDVGPAVIRPLRYFPRVHVGPPGKNPGSDGPDDERRPLGPEEFASEAVAVLVSAVSLKEAAEGMPNKAAAQRIVAEVDSTISALIDDDICPRWPGPPPPWPLVSQIVAEVTLFANSLAPGSLRTGLAQVGSRILEEFARRRQADD